MSQPIDLDLKYSAQPACQAEAEPLLAIERRVNALYLEAGRIDSDDHIARIGQEIDDLEAEISQAVPRTLTGIAVKVRHLWDCARESAGCEDEINLRTILEALEALTAAGQQVEDLEVLRPAQPRERKGGLAFS